MMKSLLYRRNMIVYFWLLLPIIFGLSEATVTLTAPSSPPCFGQTYKLTCTHPVLDGDILLGWERNGTGFNPQSTPNHDDDGNTTTTTLTITVTREEFENKVYTFRCITFDLNVGLSDPNRDISNEVTIDRPETVAIRNVSSRPRSQSNSLYWRNSKCFQKFEISYNITHCMKSNGEPDMSSCVYNEVYNRENFTIQPLIPNSLYHVTIQAASVQYPENISVVHEMDIFTLMAHNVTFQPHTVCYDRQVQLTCHHHDITDTTSSGPIFSQTSPVVWMKDGERIDLPDTYHMVVSQSNTETVVNVTTRKSVFLNGEANYSCAVVYADGSLEESEPVTVRVRESPLPPTSLTSIPSDTSISLMWSHSDECFGNCTFMYEVTWQQSGDGSSLGNTTTTETSYTIEGLAPGTSYEIGIGAYCKENPNIRSEVIMVSTSLPVCPVWLCVWLPIIIVIMVLIIVMMVVVVCCKCKVNKMKDNLPLENANEEKTQSLHTSQASDKNIQPQQPTSYLAEINKEETPVRISVPDVIETSKETKMSDEASKTVSKSNEPQQQPTSYYADLDHSKDRPKAVANPNLGDGVYNEVLTRK